MAVLAYYRLFCLLMAVLAYGWLSLLTNGCSCLLMAVLAYKWMSLLTNGCPCLQTAVLAYKQLFLLTNGCFCLLMAVLAYGWLFLLTNGPPVPVDYPWQPCNKVIVEVTVRLLLLLPAYSSRCCSVFEACR